MSVPDTAVRFADPDRIRAAHIFAERAHEGQTYTGHNGRSDEPYIRHPVRVARAVPPGYRVVALLHDCMEDAGVLPEWITETEREALALLTRGGLETYAAYIARLKDAPGPAGAIARCVKIADLRDNIAHDPPARLRDRYCAALDVLEAS